MMSAVPMSPANARQVLDRVRGSAVGRLARAWAAALLLMLTCLAIPGAHAQPAGTVWTAMNQGTSYDLLGCQVVAFNNKLVAAANPHLYGSMTGAEEIWVSSDGNTWKRTMDGPWAAGSSELVVYGGKLWSIPLNLDNIGDLSSYVSEDGVHWTVVSDQNPPWEFCAATVTHGSQVWAIDQAPGTNGRAQIWRSSDMKTWTPVRNDGAWGVRRNPAVVSFNGKLWLMGGSATGLAEAAKNDVWSSSDGSSWTLVKAAAGWTPRFNHRAIVYANKIWILGGCDASRNVLNDVWSSTDGVQWTKVGNAAWPARHFHGAAVFNNRLWVIGGYGKYYSESLLNDSWFTADLAGAPQIQPLADAEVQELQGYQGPQPILLQGERPITWSIVQAPAGMTVDPATGVVHWSKTVAAAAPYTITLRAANAKGQADVTWHLNVKLLRPPNPEGMLDFAGTGYNPPYYSGGSGLTLSWTAVPEASGYTLQRSESQDFLTSVTEVNLGATALRYTFTGMRNGVTYYYRLCFHRANGLTSVWCWAVPVLHDSVPPVVTVTPLATDKVPTAHAVRLIIVANDPGTPNSGLRAMRFKVGAGAWTDWEFVAYNKLLYVPQAGTQTVSVQVRDVAWNVTERTIAATVPDQASLFVNSSAPAGSGTGAPSRPFRTIQEAIDWATDGTEVVVQPGTYKENLSFKGKNIVLRSTEPNSPAVARATVIDGQAKGAVISFAGTETAAAMVSGLTLTNGKSSPGAAVTGNRARATIQNNRLLNNVAYTSSTFTQTIGGGFVGYYTFYYITYNGQGGAIANCDGTIQNNIIAFNRIGAPAPFTSSEVRHYYTFNYGGEALFDCRGTVRNNTIWGNGAARSSALYNCTGQILNNIIYDNNTSSTAQLSGCAVPAYCAIEGWTGGGTGNLASDPRLVDPLNDDFHLKADSPCIDAGGAAPGLATDFEGTPRGIKILTTTRGDGSGVDIGADEYQPPQTVAAPMITLVQGADASSLKVSLQCAAAGAAIRCTWGGNEPTGVSPLYTGPLVLRGTPGSKLTVKARAFKAGSTPSPVVTQTWTFPTLTITQLSRAGVVVDTLAAGKKVYGDRAIAFAAPVPSLYNGQLYLRTLNGDKAGGVGLSFTVNKPVMVYVAMSEAFGTTRPAWLAGWIAASNPLTTTDVIPGRKLYRKAFPAGRVTLGANREGTMPNGPSMYSVLVLPQ